MKIPQDKSLVSISKAAEILGISIDTLRRWEKAGTIKCERPNGKDRYFSIEELEKHKFQKPLSISEASEKLGVSATTLRRLEKKGLIKPERNGNGERLYNKKSLEDFLNSEYFLREKEIEEQILEPLEPNKSKKIPKEEQNFKVFTTTTTTLKDLLNFRNAFYKSGLFLATLFVLLVITITALFLLFPQDTASFFGYRNMQLAKAQDKSVLGSSFPNGRQKVNGNGIGKLLKPFSRVSLGLVSAINPEVYKKIVPERAIEDVNEVFAIDEEGNVTVNYAFKPPDSSYLQIPDKELIENLNAQYLQGKGPGSEEGDLIVLGENGTVEALRIDSTNVLSDAIGTLELADSSVTTAKLADGAVTSAKLASGVLASLAGEDSVLSKHIKDGEVKSAEILDNTISANDLGQTLTFADDDFIDLSLVIHDDTTNQGLRLPNAASATPTSPTSGEGYIAWNVAGNQLLVYNGSSWTTVGGNQNTFETFSVSGQSNVVADSTTDTLALAAGSNITITTDASTDTVTITSTGGSGSAITVEEGDTTIDATVTNFDFLASDFAVSESPEDEVNISIDYTNSKIVRSDQSETIAAGWVFTGGITANDASADTILIGQSGTTDDTVTIAGDVSITDDNWAISATGVGTGLTANDLSCTDCIGATEISEGTIASTGLSDTADIGYLNQSETVVNDWTFSLAEAEDLAINISISGTQAGQGELITLTNSSTSGNQYGLKIDNAASTGTTESLIFLDNSDTDTVVTSAIEVANTSRFTNILLLGATGLTATELSLLDGKTTLVDIDDAVGTAITGTGALGSGSITSGFGAIDVGTDGITGGAGSFTTLAATGNINFDDAGADTILIGQSGTTDDTVTIAGDLSLTDDQWSISAAGAGSFVTGTVIGSQTFTTNNIADSGALTIKSATVNALTLDSGTTGTVNLGTSNNAKTIAIGTGTAGNTINIGTNNTTLDTINIGSALDDVAITGDQWSVTNAGVLTVVSCTGCGGGGGTLQQAYDAGNTITTDATGDVTITLAELVTPTTFEVFNNDTAGTTAVEIDNTIASGTLTNGLFIEQSGAGTLTNAIQIAETAGTITDGILITGTLGNILNTGSIDITGAGAITGATGVTSSGTITFSGLTADRLVSTTTGGALATSITSANAALSVSDETGSGVLVFGTSPTFTTNITLGADTVSDFTGTGIANSGGALTVDQVFSPTWTGIQTFSPSGTNDVIINGDQDSNVQLTNTLTSDATSVNSLDFSTVINAAAGAATVYGVNINQADNTTNTGVVDAIVRIQNANAAETTVDGILINQTGAGTLTNGLRILESAGAITTGINLASAFTTGIDAGNNIIANIGAAGTDFSSTGGLTLADALAITTGGATVTAGGLTITAGALAVNSDSITSDGELTINATSKVIITAADTFETDDVTSASGSDLTLTAGAADGDVIFLQAEGSSSIGVIQVGAGGPTGSTTPDFLALDVKSDTGDPAGGAEGYMYYNTADNVFRCFESAAWKNCDTTSAGGGITTIEENDVTVVSSATNIDFLGTDFVVGAVGAEGNISIDYTNSGITRKNENEAITGDWSFSFAGGEALDITNSTLSVASDTLSVSQTLTGDVAADGLSITVTDNNASASTATNFGLNLVNADNAGNTSVIDALALFSNDQATETLADGIIIRHNASSGTLTDGLQIQNTTAGGTITNAINIVETAGTITTGINIGTGVGTAISLQNAETIDNTTDGTIAITATTTDLSGALQAGSSNIAVTDSTGHVQHDSIVDCADGQILKWATGGGEWGCASDSTGSGPTTKYLNTQHNISSTTATEVTGISTTLTAGTYVFKYSLIVQSAATGTGIGFGINYTGTATSFVATEYYIGTGTAASTGTLDDTNTGIASEQIIEGSTTRAESTTAPNMNVITGVAAAAVNNYVTIEGVMVVSDGGDIELWHNSDTTAQSSVMVGSSLIITQITVGADLAEIYGTMDASIVPGDVVSLDSTLKAGVKKSDKPYDRNTFGIISTSPGIVTGSLKDPEAMPVMVALAGRVPVKVTTENGPIKVGDLLTSSSIPGVAMKATKAGQVIGQAMSEYGGEGVGKVMVFIKTDYWNGGKLADLLPGLTFSSEDSAVNLADLSSGRLLLNQFISQKEQFATSVDLSEIVTDRIAAGIEVITSKITTSEVNLDKISASTGKDIALNLTSDGKFIIKDEEGNTAISFDSEGNAFFKGTVLADKVKANQIEGLELITDKISSLASKIAGIATSSAQLHQDFAGQATESAEFSSELQSNAIDFASALKNIDVETAKVKLDMEVLGKLTATGIIVLGPAEFKDETIFNKLATFVSNAIFKGDVEFFGRVTFNKDTAGFAIITKETDRVEVIFEREYSQTPLVNISITLEDSDEVFEDAVLANDVKYAVTKLNKKGFTIKLNKVSSEDLKFSWVAVAVKDAKTVRSIAPVQVPSPTPEIAPVIESQASISTEASISAVLE